MRTIVTSDVHLGSRHCAGETFLRFLRALPPDAALVLNGDTVNYQPHFTPPQREVLAALRKESLRRPVVWVRGNHDARYRLEDPARIDFRDAYALDHRLYVAHGHQFEHLTSRYAFVLSFFRAVYRLRCLFYAETVHVASYARKFPVLYRLLQDHVAHNAVELARREGFSGVACGHTHTPEERSENGIRYFNTGAWTENSPCCLVVNDDDMRLRPAAEIAA